MAIIHAYAASHAAAVRSMPFLLKPYHSGFDSGRSAHRPAHQRQPKPPHQPRHQRRGRILPLRALRAGLGNSGHGSRRRHDKSLTVRSSDADPSSRGCAAVGKRSYLCSNHDRLCCAARQCGAVFDAHHGGRRLGVALLLAGGLVKSSWSIPMSPLVPTSLSVSIVAEWGFCGNRGLVLSSPSVRF
jgi:hypothetical protein